VPERPTVSVIVPFAGEEAQLDAVLERLARLERRLGDELLVVDNRAGAQARADRRGPVLIVTAGAVAAPGFARNEGARRSTGDWLVLLDADTDPAPGLLDAYFDPLPAPDVGLLAGALQDRYVTPTPVARYVVARRMMDQATTLTQARPFAQTANCAVRRTAFEQVGGFDATARAGEDADLTWRLAAAGWRLDTRPRATAAHQARESLVGLLGQMAVHGAGAAWLDRRYAGAFPAPGARALAGRLRHYGRLGVRAARAGRWEEARFALLDLLTLYAFDAGRLRSNRTRERGNAPPN